MILGGAGTGGRAEWRAYRGKAQSSSSAFPLAEEKTTAF